jgi:RNA polymerase sigma factor (sigma-70 family)
MTDVTQYDSIIKTALSRKRVRKDQREDMSQECYVALLEREAELDPELAGKICRTRIETILREQEQKRTKKENKIRFVSADLPSVSRLLSKIATEQEGPISETELYQAVDSLDENYRAAVREVYVNGLTQKDAAEKLGITIWSLRWKLSCGIMDLKLKLEVKD